MTNDRQFYPGQEVLVVPEPVDCIYGWVDGMDSLCGAECTVRAAAKNGDHWWICLHEDQYGFAWDENCFVSEEPSVSIEGLNNLL